MTPDRLENGDEIEIVDAIHEQNIHLFFYFRCNGFKAAQPAIDDADELVRCLVYGIFPVLK
ncbi:MAG: hypothetical protein J2P54_09800 [Bradyrhizobiaceae bacterium]|nr:hypothetical protein [Bradyrhizobiaceae bacterium]